MNAETAFDAVKRKVGAGSSIRQETVSAALRVVAAGVVGALAPGLLCVVLAAPPVDRHACLAWRTPTPNLPDPEACVRHAALPAPTESAGGTPPQAILDALYAQADADIKAGRFPRAAKALACAEARAASDDWRARHEVMRRYGVLAYRQERVADALGRFECALSMASSHEDRAAFAKDLKNVGSALRRLGDLRNALQALTTSLAMQRAQGDAALGPVLNNLADVYRELNEPQRALRHYRDALTAFQARGDHVEAAHVLESLSVLALDRGDAAEAKASLEAALQLYQQTGSHAYQLRVYAGLARVALARGAREQARTWIGDGTALAATHGLPLPAAFELQASRLDRLSNAPQAAIARLRRALSGLSATDVDRVALLEEWAAGQQAQGDLIGAMETLRRAHEAERQRLQAQQDRQLGWLRARFEAEERDRTIAALETQNQLREATLAQRTLQMWLILAGAVVAILVGAMVWLRRRQRARLAETARQVRHEEELARYRRETQALLDDRARLQTLLDSREDAVCLLDAEGQVLAANRAARGWLSVADGTPVGHAFADALAGADRNAVAAALERMEDDTAQRLDITGPQGTALVAQFEPWERGDGLIVVALREAATPPPTPAVADDGNRHDTFRRALVELMLAVVDNWERSSGQSRLELAEKSRIWRVYVDDGRLRARAMERYLALSKLPRNPRWRDVLRSAYFVLGQCALDDGARAALQGRVDEVLAHTRRNALV